MSKIVKIIFDDGEELGYVEEPIESFHKDGRDEKVIKVLFNRQHRQFEEEVIDNLKLDVEEYAKREYNLIDEDDTDLKLYSDEQILEEAEYRGLMPEGYSQNTNIYNQDFIDRFSVIMDRGDDVEIEKTLQLLEYRFKIG